MALTTTQLQTLKAVALADPTAAGFLTAGNDTELAAWFNADAVPDFFAWRTSVSKHEIVSKTSIDGTTFAWAGNGFISRSVGELECWNQLFNSTQTCNPSLANVRQAFQDIFSGAGNAASNRSHLLVVARRKVNRFERTFATGTGTTIAPGTLVEEGSIDTNIAAAIRTA